MSIRTILFAVSFCLPIAVTHANEGRLLASQCAQCHGTDGHSANGIDSLAGESYNEIYGEMLEMKGENENDIMHAQARGYSDAQIHQMALYFSSLTGNGSSDD